MPQCCAVPMCSNKTGGHKFPKNKIRLKQWLVAIRRDRFTPTNNSLVCKDHFSKDDYELPKDSVLEKPRLMLKKNVVPSRFPWNEATYDLLHHKRKGRKWRCLDRNTRKKENIVKTNQNVVHNTSDMSFDCTKVVIISQTTPADGALPQKVTEDENKSADTTNFIRDRSVRLRNKKAYLANRRCSVPQCNMKPSKEISLHPCPNNAAVRNEWAEALRVSYHYVKSMVACSLHFMKIDFIQSRNTERVLKHNAVPSRNLPHRKKGVLPAKNRPIKKEVPSSAFERQKTMTNIVDDGKEAVPEEEIRECRACLIKLDDKISCCNVFQAWAPPWDGMEATIAEDLAKLANVEITITDRHSKVLCAPCYQKLLDAAKFASNVRSCDKLLRMRFTAEIDMERVWPKPIQVDKNINGSVYNNPMDIEIKQEVVSDDEYPTNGTDNAYAETELANLDIKIEPEEFVEPPPMNITINGTISLDPLNSENKDLTNGTELDKETEYLELAVKQEPMSEEEQESDQVPDLPLECLLCTKSFNSVTGLKAHVIAQHSYKTVKRKSNGSVSPEKKRCDKHQCAICRRNFQTSTDLMVHETCHNKHVCYGCTEKFDSFELLSRHRKRCKASMANSVQKLKTLEDVTRPHPHENVEYLELGIKNDESNNIKKEVDNVMTIKEESEVKNLESVPTHLSIKQENILSDVLETDMTEVESKNEEEIVKETDSNINLHLETNLLKMETESAEDDGDMQVETLENEDCT